MTLWKAMAEQDPSLRSRLGSGDPTLTRLLGTYMPGEAVDTMFASTLVGASRTLTSQKDTIMKAQLFGSKPTTGTSRGYTGGKRPPNQVIK